MICVEFSKKGNYYYGMAIQSRGAQNAAGDAAIYAVSTLAYTLIGGLEELLHRSLRISLKGGHLSLLLNHAQNEETELLFKTIHLGMKLVEDHYPELLRVNSVMMRERSYT